MSDLDNTLVTMRGGPFDGETIRTSANRLRWAGQEEGVHDYVREGESLIYVWVGEHPCASS